MSLSIGIDLGTSACRVAVLDSDNQLLNLSRVQLPAPKTDGLHCEQSSEKWWQACQTALTQALEHVDSEQVTRIAVDGTSSTLLLCDESGHVDEPALMYRDQRSQSQAKAIADFAPASAAVHSPSSSLAKLLWLKDNGRLKTGLRALHQADWITGKLRGQYDVSDENNALKLGYDAANRQWPSWFSKSGLLQAYLPKIIPAGTVLGPVDHHIASQFGFKHDCQVVSGTTDSTATFIASGVHEVGDALSVLGSTLVIKILADKPIFSPEFGVYSHRLGDKWLVGGASNSGGAVLRQFFTDQQLEQLSHQINPAKLSQLQYMPLPGMGERFPVNDPQLRPCFTPRPKNDVDFLHGLLTSISRIEQQGYATLHKLGAPMPNSIRTSGGGAKNKTWQALRSQLLNTSLLTAEHDEAAIGAAMLANNAVEQKHD